MADIHGHIDRTAFSSQGADRLGVEIEWLCLPASDPTTPLSPDSFSTLVRSVQELPLTSSITFEPGGQLELSSPALTDRARVGADLLVDIAQVKAAAAGIGLRLEAIGLDPAREPARMIDNPRYSAMEAYFGGHGAAGKEMMCNTAAVQVNLDPGSPEQVAERWRVAHGLGPVLAATFANSPFERGKPSGWRSTRLATWWAIDATRTAPAYRESTSPVEAWMQYALEARVLLIRNDGIFLTVESDLTFEGWMSRGHELGWPTLDDFEYHLTTLFPPVRARGWIELRMFDALPDPWWWVAAAVTTALLYDPDAFTVAAEATAPVRNSWMDAFRNGLQDPRLGEAARLCFGAAIDALPRAGFDERTVAVTSDFYDRFVARGRTPADALLEAWAKDGALFPDIDYDLEAAWT